MRSSAWIWLFSSTQSTSESYGFVTQSAIALPEIKAPERPRVFCIAITNEDVAGRVPTSWSAALDQACAGDMPGDTAGATAPRLLLFVSAGNIPDTASLKRQPIRTPFRSRIRRKPGMW